jgi:ABC-2 type transport system permease protein
MNRFLWLVRREVWEHKAIWFAPSIVIACLFLLLAFARAHLGYDVGMPFSDLARDAQIVLHQFAYLMVAAIVFFVMGVIAFFYAIDSLYADRNDRSVLFWKSLPLSDAETVLSKFATGVVVVPVVALLGSVIAQFVAGGVIMAKLAVTGEPVGFWLHPEALAGGALIAVVACLSVILWYAPLVAYLMLVSAWAPRAPFLWAVLPPVAAMVLERIVMETSYIQDFIASRLFGVLAIFHGVDRGPGDPEPKSLSDLADRLAGVDAGESLRAFYSSPDLWLGVVAAGLLLAAAMWVRRYRDETS